MPSIKYAIAQCRLAVLKSAMKSASFAHSCVACFFVLALRNCYKLRSQLTLKTIRNNCELFTRSMRGAWLVLTIQRRRHGYPSPSTRNLSSGLMK
jgi:hypothetical protein